jgi:hypothetical protein
MERRPIPAIVISCHTCGLVRIADDYHAAYARASAHIHLSGHHEIQYTAVESPERLRLAEAFEQRSRKAVKGYARDEVATSLEALPV